MKLHSVPVYCVKTECEKLRYVADSPHLLRTSQLQKAHGCSTAVPGKRPYGSRHFAHPPSIFLVHSSLTQVGDAILATAAVCFSLQTSYNVPSRLCTPSATTHYCGFPWMLYFFSHNATRVHFFSFFFSTWYARVLLYPHIQSLRCITVRLSASVEKRPALHTGAWHSFHVNRAALDCRQFRKF